MKRWMMVLILLLLVVPVQAQSDSSTCGSGSGQPAPVLTASEEADPTHFAEHFNTSILDYLNTTGSSDGLEAALIATTGQAANTVPATYAQVLQSDITGDSSDDVLVNLAINYGAGFNSVLSLFGYVDATYTLLGSVSGSDWTASSTESPTRVLYAVDINNNQRREIFLKTEYLLGQKYGEGLTIYEWDGSVLKSMFSYGPDLGGLSHIRLEDKDSDPATLEFTIGDVYGYGESVAMAVIEITHWRPIDVEFQWDGNAYQHDCIIFSDQPGTLYEMLHSAEALARCGRYDEAVADYQLLIEGDLLAWAEIDDGPPWSALPFLIYPETVSDKKAYAAELEQAYLSAFATYRIAQLALLKGDEEGARNGLQFAKLDSRPGSQVGSPGYEYFSAATTLVESYHETQNMKQACAAAQVTFNEVRANGDDPGITYYADTFDGQTMPYPFYRSSDIVYSPNPDNLFDVPQDISDVVSIPFCLE